MAHTLPDLPYEQDALEPHISSETLGFHHGKHHAAYVSKMNAAIEGNDKADLSLEDLIRKAAADGDQGLFNNAAQTWNHTFYWNSMAPDGGGTPSGDLGERIERDFGSFDAFKKAFADAGATQFGSGWAWLVVKDGKLDVRKTLNAETPLTEDGVVPLLTMDVWEHAYYLDFQNRRPDYIDTFLDKLVNWEFAASNLKSSGQ
ncbi:superoxide dismutase [Hyphobacterium sp. CCMP332]|uniref:superoxide dismutase n=1 Tax=Hyphobacterium sp. CCMP332 TaxID=2749086 RepID=UPI0016502484|nr:superoxide dismutase [Hyphobacterium sp. CCMP332]QNL19064.1 superoxide dismutase [Hyphobacterium sp. CCMP332]